MTGLLLSGKKTPLPLRDTLVEGEIKGYVLGLKSTLKYVNDSPDPVEVLFRFPLEQSHAVVGLTALIDGQEIRAQLREKEEARAAYDDAIASGQSAALGEERSGDVFSISLGNLPPQKEAEIRLQLVGELPIDAEGSVRFSLPTALKPRYTPTGSTNPLEPVPGEETGQVERARVSGVQKFCLRVQEAGKIAEVTSPTHSIAVTSEGEELVVSISDQMALSKDLIVLIRQKEPHQPKAIIEAAQDGNSFMSSSVVMVNFFPEFTSEEASCEFIFLVDRSGSMSGSYIRSARETLILFLKSLPENSYFNIIGFGSSYKKLFDHSVQYSQETLDRATRHAEKMDADLGGTELLPPLRYIFAQKAPLPGLPRQLFVLTDGSVSNTEHCIEAVRSNVDSARCFTFGIGSGASTALVEGLALAGNGMSEFVKGGERLQPKVIRSLKRALQPAVTNVRVTFTVPSGYEAIQSPHKLPPVFNGEKMVVYGIIRSPSTARPRQEQCEAILQGLMQGKSVEYKIPFTLDGSATGPSILPTVHHLAGKALISDWVQGRKEKEEIVKLSIESGVISTYTAFIAVDEESSEPIRGAMKTWDIQAEEMTANPRIAALSAQVNAVKGIMRANISQATARGDTFEDLDERAVYLSQDASMFQRTAHQQRRRGLLSSIGSMFSSLFSSGEAGTTPGHRQTSDSAQVDEPTPELSSALTRDSYEEEFEEGEVEESAVAHPVQYSLPREANEKAASSTRPSADVSSSLISLQQADGSWQLTSSLAGLLSKSESVLKKACPTDCQGEVGVVWATVLVLTVLRAKYSSQQEEWELVAMKADRWLKRQTLPAGLTLQDLYRAAEKVFA